MHRRAIPRTGAARRRISLRHFTARNRTTASPFFRKRAARSARSACATKWKIRRRASSRRRSATCAFSPIYAPNGQAVGSPAYEYKIAMVSRACELPVARRNALGASLVVCGDFNVAPNDEDVHDPGLWRGAIMCSEGERAAFRALCELGLADTLRLHHPEAGLFSWWDYRMLAFPKNRGLRIDAILASKSLAAKLHRCRHRSRNAQRQGSVRSRAGLGGVWMCSGCPASQRVCTDSDFLTLRR